MQVQSRIEVGELAVNFAAAKVPYAVLLLDDGRSYPLCLFLHGGGGSHQNLIDMRPLFERWWSDGSVAPMVTAMASTGAMSYYLDHPDGSARWESFIAEDFLAHNAIGNRRLSPASRWVVTGASRLHSADPSSSPR
jgi:hypothetical protein